MTWLFDVVLAGVVLEALALLAYRRLTGRGVAAKVLVPNLAAGGLLLAAARIALGGAAWEWASACLLAALAAHLIDLRQRWQTDGS